MGKRYSTEFLNTKDKELVFSLVKEIPKVPRGIGQHPKTRHNPRPRNEVTPYWLSTMSSDKCKRKPLWGRDVSESQ
jgi:hypothetical protein